MKDELREAALIQYTHDYWINDEAEIHFNNGFDAGYEAGKPKWIPVGQKCPCCGIIKTVEPSVTSTESDLTKSNS